MTQENNEQPGEKKRKVAKTLLYRKPLKAPETQEQQPSPGQESSPAQQPSPAPQPEPIKAAKVAKTKLDHKMIANVRAQFGLRENERLQEEIAKRESEPVKIIDPIKAQKKVKSCPFSWGEDSVKLRFKHCSQCQTPIYHLDGMEAEEADALILKRENREKYVLYERPDGKFMTSDCPVAKKRRIQTAGLVAAVSVCVVVAVIAFIMMPPPPAPPPTANSSNDAGTPAAVTTDVDSSKGSSSTSGGASSTSDSSSTGTHHYEAGDPVPAVPSSGMSTKKPEKTFSEPEQSGDFWQYSNGQPSDDSGHPHGPPYQD